MLLDHEGRPLGPVLEGARIRIEPIGPERATAFLAGRPEPDLAWEEAFPLPPLLDLLSRVNEAPDGPIRFGPFFAYAIIRRADGLAVGDIGFHGPPGDAREVEIGYALVPQARGTGLATESVELLVRWALAEPGVDAVTARVEPENSSSVRLLERVGFRADGEA